jgi:molybdenum ABC transporter molybdate-binding protein
MNKTIFKNIIFVKYLHIWQLFFFFSLIIFIFSTNAFALNARNINVYSDPNLAPAIIKIARDFSQKNNAIITINLDSSADFLNNLDEESYFDVFISANSFVIDALKQKGLIDVYNIFHVTSDKLILVCKKDTMLPINMMKENINLIDSLKIIDDYRLNLIINHKNTSEGFYSKKILDNIEFKNLKVFEKIPEDRSPLLHDIEDNSDSYGLIFASKLVKNNSLRIISSDQERSYQAMAIAGNNMELAREFLKFLKTENAKKIFTDNGFINN